jgi:cell division protein FtsL
MEQVEELATETDKRLSVHEAVCQQRYEVIQTRFDEGSKRMTRIEYLLYVVILAVLLGPNVAADFVKKTLGL